MLIWFRLPRTVWESWSMAVWVETLPLMSRRKPSRSPAIRTISSRYQMVILTLTFSRFTGSLPRPWGPG